MPGTEPTFKSLTKQFSASRENTTSAQFVSSSKTTRGYMPRSARQEYNIRRSSTFQVLRKVTVIHLKRPTEI